MSLLDSNGKKIHSEPTGFRVDSYQWVPKEMLIMISSRNVVVMMAGKKYQMTHAKYEKFKRDLQERWNGKTEIGPKEQAHEETKEGVEEAAQERQSAPH